jgi:two-component system, NarL family, response regulator LiaR
MNSSIHVVVVEDGKSEWRGLAVPRLKHDDLLLAVVAHNSPQALELCAMAQPDMVILEMPNPERDGAEASRAIGSQYPHTRVIVLAASTPDVRSHSTLAVRAPGSSTEGARAFEPYRARAATGPANTVGASLRSGHAEHLTTRELEVLALLAEGLTNLQIAARLCISRATVKFHVSSILAKLHSPTRAAAVAVAMQQRLASQYAREVG